MLRQKPFRQIDRGQCAKKLTRRADALVAMTKQESPDSRPGFCGYKLLFSTESNLVGCQGLEPRTY